MLYTRFMPGALRASASIIVAAVLAIVGHALLLLLAIFGLVILWLSPSLSNAAPMPQSAGAFAAVGEILLLGISIVGIVMGIGLLLLRNWARITAVIFASFFVFFGLIGIPMAFLIPVPPPPAASGLPADSFNWVRWILLAIYLIPLAIGLWWVILFNRKAIKTQFALTAEPSGSAQPLKFRGPLPITVLAWFLITSALNLFIVPFIPHRLPTILFGRLVSPPAAVLLLVFVCLLSIVLGIGLLKLKPWSYSFLIALQIVWLASAVVSLLSPNFATLTNIWTNEMTAMMHLPPDVAMPAFLQNPRWIWYLALIGPVLVLGLLIFYRRRFLEAASKI